MLRLAVARGGCIAAEVAVARSAVARHRLDDQFDAERLGVVDTLPPVRPVRATVRRPAQ
jgi:hypothetical protein